MRTANQPTNETPIPREQIAAVAAEYAIDEAALTESLEQLYGTLFEGADAIQQYYQSADDPVSYVVAGGIAEVIFIPTQMWNTLQTDLRDEMRAAVKAVHAEFARDLGISPELPAAAAAFVMPSERVGELVRAGLSPRQAEVHVLRDAGFTQAEIGERLGMATNTVKVHCHRVDTKVANARRLLRHVDP